MTKLEEYADKYDFLRMERRDGILQITFHTDGDSLKWSRKVQMEAGLAFADIGNDVENKIVIMTGTGDDFCTQSTGSRPSPTPGEWENIRRAAIQQIMNLLDIEVPMICAVNGPFFIHAHLGLLCDIVLAAEEAAFQDGSHITIGAVPGDGSHVVWPALLGPNRGRYLLLTGQKLSAQEALDLGLVNEVLPRESLLPRAWELAELAEQLAAQPPLTLRYTRVVLTLQLKRLMQEGAPVLLG